MLGPKSVFYMRYHKKMNVLANILVEKFEDEGLPTGKVVVVLNNGESSFSNRDCQNHIRNLQRNNLDVGDIEFVFNYYKRKQVENRIFFIQSNTMKSLGWLSFFLGGCQIKSSLPTFWRCYNF